MTRIAKLFERLGREDQPGLIAYITAGDPDPGRTASLVLALERGGADLIELGVPFSDPIADGPVIQLASERALRAGTTLHSVLDIARQIRAQSEIPLLLFSYMNPLVRYGFEALARDAVQAGIDGCLFTDLSVEEADPYVASIRKAGLDTVFLAAPTSTMRRLQLVAQYSTGFVYLVSRTGVTGEHDSLSDSIGPLVKNMRAVTSLPLAVGFGISRPEQAATVGRLADAAVVGTAIVKLVQRHGADPDLESRLESFARDLKQGLRRPA
ncbi:MAG: tryptophan synthase subunit alpha [Acidobacteriia bacterium]|nr:tryptophan synthase subunit alpha [Terriglobia bacterium]